MSLLQSINSPADLKKLDKRQLPQLAEEVRQFMLETVSKCGGHLAPSLGVVELTIALHYCYTTPDDKIVWDVGHQAYAHKILTCRREQFTTLRQFGGISGFPRTRESIHDALSTGHASTSISAALGMAKARDIKGEKFHVVAVIGDGSLSGGLAFEGLNNLGTHSTDMTVILNDNEMSISKNVGALSRYLTRIITDKRFNKLKTDVWELLGNMSHVGMRIRSMVQNFDEIMKRLVTPGKFFEDMGLRYIGPVNGHNINELIDILTFTKQIASGPVLIHILTKKGKGYSFAENNSTKFHGIGQFSLHTGNSTATGSAIPTYSEIFGKTLVELAEKQNNIVAITAAMPDGTGLHYFQKRFPSRFFDVGIAESHAVTFAAGLALQGMRPVVALYSTFLQRAYDNLLHDIALDKLNVVFCIDRAGLVGDDGPTHHGCFDLTYLRSIPGATIMAPKNELELRDMLFTSLNYLEGPIFIRYPRGSATGLPIDTPMEKISLFQPELIKKGRHIALCSIGTSIKLATDTGALLEQKNLKPTLINARFVKPLDKEFYSELFLKHSIIVTFETNSKVGGFGSAISELAVVQRKPIKVIAVGFPDEFIPHGSNAKLMETLRLTPEEIAADILALEPT
ncbi:MAG: 1-deoxy-D-xylulose-5-phosphate synthase [Chitinivibrionales bacterium]|nr:1-deoxy-D-xylulose-5-phosphate synthase [Chitinivibrionales bacterium]